jgi:polyisoprenoid-binding protein YceI
VKEYSLPLTSCKCDGDLANGPFPSDIEAVWYRLIVALSILTVGSPAVLPGESYAVDLRESSLTFTISNLGVNTVEGRFHDFDGELTWTGNVADLQLTGTIAVESIDTGIRLRDRHLRGADYFDVATFPEITYRSTTAEWVDGEIVISGDLRIKDVTREIRLTATISPPPREASDAPGAPAVDTLPVEVILTADGSIDRRPFGVVPDGPRNRLIGEIVQASGRFVGRIR